jgi:ABC-2 type transport system permease protein
VSRSALGPLVRRSLARSRRLYLAAAAALAAFQVMIVVVAASFQQMRSFDLLSAMMPMGVQQTLGPGALMLASFTGMVTFGYFHPIVVLAVIQLGAYAATEPAGEVEWGLFDLQLSRPVPRHAIVTRSLLVAFGTTAACVAAMIAGTWIGLSAFAPPGAAWPMASRLSSLAGHLLLTAWFFAGVGLAAGAFARRRGTAFGATAGAALGLYLLNFLADAWPRAASLRPLSPFHYFPGFGVANGAAPIAWDFSVLAAGAAGLVAIAFWRFERRDL